MVSASNDAFAQLSPWCNYRTTIAKRPYHDTSSESGPCRRVGSRHCDVGRSVRTTRPFGPLDLAGL